MNPSKIDEFIPGRLCILGEHTDWIGGSYRHLNRRIAKGYALVCSTSEGIHARCNIYKPGYLRYIYNKSDGTTDEFVCELNKAKLSEIAKSGVFCSYVAASVLACMERQLSDSGNNDMLLKYGIEINNYKTTLPMKKGLSSSAAICVLIATCYNKLFQSGVLDTASEVVAIPDEASPPTPKPTSLWSRADIMNIAYIAESVHTQSKCGRMDQCVAMGKDAIGLMEFEDYSDCVASKASQDISLLYCHCPLYFVVANVNGSKNTVEILSALNACFPFPQNSIQSRMHRYAAHNHKLIWNAVTAIESGNAQMLGSTMRDAQQLFDNCAIENCPTELKAPKLHVLLNHAGLNKLCWGMKGVGSQGDGSIQLLCKGVEEQTAVLDILKKELNCECFPLTIPASVSSIMNNGNALSNYVNGNGEKLYIEAFDNGIAMQHETTTPATTTATNSNGTLLPPTITIQTDNPNSNPNPTVLLHPNKVRCALIVTDGNILTRNCINNMFQYLGNNCIQPCLLPLPYKDGITTFLMSLINELIVTHGISRIAVVVTASRNAWYDAELQMAEDIHVAPPMLMKGKNTFSTADVFTNVNTNNNKQNAKDSSANTIQYQYVNAFTSLPSYIYEDSPDNISTRSSCWNSSSEEFEYMKARTRFFFEDPSNAMSPYGTMMAAVEMLMNAAEKLTESHVIVKPIGTVAGGNGVAVPDTTEGIVSANNSGNMLSALINKAAPATSNAKIAPSNTLTDKKYLGPILVCRAESIPQPRMNTSSCSSSASPSQEGLLSRMINQLTVDWNDRVCISNTLNNVNSNTNTHVNQVVCTSGYPIVGLIPTNAPAMEKGEENGMWVLDVPVENAATTALICNIPIQVEEDAKMSMKSHQFSGQCLLSITQLYSYLKYHHREYQNSDGMTLPNWLKLNLHPADGVIRGITVATSAKTKNVYKCKGITVHHSNVLNVMNTTDYNNSLKNILIG